MARETELYKDKIEVSLDGRQIFYLFFGGAVIVGLVFVLGVMVGRRVEARGHVERAHVEATIDPLAALDRLEGGSALSFQGSLRGDGAPSEVEKTIAEMAKAAPPPPAAAPVPTPAPAPKPADVPKKADKDDKKVDRDKDDKKAERDKDDKKDDKKAERDKDDKPEPKPEKKPRFTLQLSSFQDKSEAQAFLDAIKGNGFAAYITEGAVDGKTFYRVRLGSYRSLEAANDAKADFEKAAKKSAQVMKL